MKIPLMQWFTKKLVIEVFYDGNYFVVRKSSNPNELICFIKRQTAEEFAEYLFYKHLELEGIQ